MRPRSEPGGTVVVPVFNEVATLARVVEDALVETDRFGAPWEILILDDGSTDGSADTAADLAARAGERVRVIRFSRNRGKGALLNEAFRRTDRELICVLDADGEYAPSDVSRVLTPLVEGRADWVYGSRYGFGRPRPAQYRATWAVNRMVNAWFAMLSGVQLHDLLTGLYAFRADLVRGVRLVEPRFAYTPELIWKVLRRGPARVIEVPVSYRFRDYAAGKKIRWWEAGTILAATLRYKFRDGVP